MSCGTFIRCLFTTNCCCCCLGIMIGAFSTVASVIDEVVHPYFPVSAGTALSVGSAQLQMYYAMKHVVCTLNYVWTS